MTSHFRKVVQIIELKMVGGAPKDHHQLAPLGGWNPLHHAAYEAPKSQLKIFNHESRRGRRKGGRRKKSREGGERKMSPSPI